MAAAAGHRRLLTALVEEVVVQYPEALEEAVVVQCLGASEGAVAVRRCLA